MKTRYPQGENLTVSVAKGLCILLVVVGHSGCPDLLGRFIYLFHVPLFFFTSGYFNKIAEDFGTLKQRLWSRVKRLYIPFVLYGLLFLLLQPLLIRVGWEVDDGRSLLTKSLLMLFKMDPPSVLLGGFWFVRSLFIAAVAADIVLFLVRKRVPVWALFLFFAFVAMGLKSFPPGTPVVRQLSLAVLGMVFFLFGMVYRSVEGRWALLSKSWMLLPALLVLLSQTLFYPGDLSISCIGALDTGVFIATALIGIYFVMGVSQWLSRSVLMGPFRYMGNQTLVILALHFLCFKLVSWAAVALYGIPYGEIAGSVVLSGLPGGWWLLYTLAGIGLPLLAGYLFDLLRSCRKS